MQGLTINDSTLYAIVNFHVYSLPLREENILSQGRLALFNLTSEGLWTEVSWLRRLVERTSQGGWGTLLQLNLLPAAQRRETAAAAAVQRKFFHAVYRRSPRRLDTLTFELLAGNETAPVKESDLKSAESSPEAPKRFAVFGDGAGNGYAVRSSGREHQSMLWLPGPVIEVSKCLFLKKFFCKT